jgi:O-methyltransferase involved in polyketide biosynthesis
MDPVVHQKVTDSSMRARDSIDVSGLGIVQETLLTPLCARADEYTRVDGIVRDQTAYQLVNSISYDFSKIRRYGNTLVGCAIRANVMDRWIAEFLSQNPNGVVTCLGVGLDTVRERNDNKKATFVELDFADVIDLRRKCFEENERRIQIVSDVLDSSWLSAVSHLQNRKWLFQAAGLLMYLQPDGVRRLFKILGDNFPGCTFLFDGCSTLAHRNSTKWEATIGTTAATYHWSIDDPREVTHFEPRVRVEETRYMMDLYHHRWSLKARIASTLSRTLRHGYHINRAHFS